MHKIELNSKTIIIHCLVEVASINMLQLQDFLLCFLFIALVGGQQAGSATKNQVLKVPMEECQAGENCQKGEKVQLFSNMFLSRVSHRPQLIYLILIIC